MIYVVNLSVSLYSTAAASHFASTACDFLCLSKLSVHGLHRPIRQPFSPNPRSSLVGVSLLKVIIPSIRLRLDIVIRLLVVAGFSR